MGVPYVLLLGILVGLFQVVPFVGPPISGAIVALVALAAVGPVKAAEVVAVFAGIQLIEGNTLVPLVLSRTVRTNPLTVIVGVIIGASLLGLPGAVLGVPLAAVIQEVVESVLAPLARRGMAVTPPLGAQLAPGTGQAHADGEPAVGPAAHGSRLPAEVPDGNVVDRDGRPAAGPPSSDSADRGG